MTLEEKAPVKLEPIREASAVLVYKEKQFVGFDHTAAYIDVEAWRRENEGATENLDLDGYKELYATAGFLTESGAYVDRYKAADHARANGQMANPNAKYLESEYLRSMGNKLS